jgi:YVTN family beta-propeller protein
MIASCVLAGASALAGAAPAVPPGTHAPRVALESVPIEATVSVPEGPGWLGTGFGSVWLSKSKSHAVYRIDPATNTVVATIPVGSDAELGIRAAGGYVWIPDTTDHSLTQIDPARNAVVRVIPIDIADDPEGSIAIADGDVWYLCNRGGTDSGTLVRMNLESGRAVATMRVPRGSHAVEAAYGAIWVAASGGHSVVRIDPRTNRVVAEVRVHAGPRFMAVGFGSLWALSQSDGSLARIDPATNRVTATFALGVPGPGGDLDMDDSHVWVAAEGTPISLVDPLTNTVRVQVVGGHELDTLRAAFGALWLVDEHGGVLRIDPARLIGISH